MTEQDGFWPVGARLAVTVSMQFEVGGQPVSGAGGPITAWVDRAPAPVSGLPGHSA